MARKKIEKKAGEVEPRKAPETPARIEDAGSSSQDGDVIGGGAKGAGIGAAVGGAGGAAVGGVGGLIGGALGEGGKKRGGGW